MASIIRSVLISKGTCVEKLGKPKNPPVSKHITFSIVAAIFDPLGLISPVIVVYKNFPAAVVAAQASLG